MNDQSPPKRVTRARAAAKSTNDISVKTTQIATAASKAKVTRAISTTKRKTRADDPPEEVHQEAIQQIIEPELPKTTRGRAKKAAVQPEPEMEEEAPAPVKPARGRPKKVVVEAAAPAPTRSLRGRAKTVETEDDEEAAIFVEEPAKKPTRARTTAVFKTGAPKKTVKFEEPDKENIVPAPANTRGKAKVTETGLKAKPVRKPVVAAPRTTRGRGKVEEKQEKSPLSPKKATQVATAKDQSEDELATSEKTPMKALMKSPIKAPGSIFGTAKKLDFSNSITVNRVATKDLGASMLGSPARRPIQSPLKESMRSEPQRPTLGDSILRSPFKFSHPAQKPIEGSSPLKASLLQSPARRPQSPTKVTESGSPIRSGNASTFGVTPKASIFKISRYATPRTLTKTAMRPGLLLAPTNISTGSPELKNLSGSDIMEEADFKFSGRLSSIMPREADTALSPSEPIVEEAENQVTVEVQPAGETVHADTIVVEDLMESQTTTPSASPQQTNSFALRDVDENPFHDSDSEDELASGSPKYSPFPLTGFKTSSHDFKSSPATPTPFTGISKTPRTGTSRNFAMPQNQQIGFTPLATQLSNWMASPIKSDQSRYIPGFQVSSNVELEISPAKSSYFDDEMTVRDEMQDVSEPTSVIDDIHFDPVDLDEEDLSLAHEADEMSLLDPESIEDIGHSSEDLGEVAQVEFTEQAFDDLIIADPSARDMQELADKVGPVTQTEETFDGFSETQPQEAQDVEELTVIEHTAEIMDLEPALSEASQEYGDENAVVLDPALFAPVPQALAAPKCFTPKRVLSERVFHTVSKVPLKAAAEESPMRPSPIKRSTSVSRLPVQRPSSNLSRSNTVISYSPAKRTTRAKTPTQDVEMPDIHATPSKPDAEIWSAIATPARTPRRDLNTALLSGAVVFVDVHTTEGADASALFTELLTQMGARCVKRWDWSGNSEDGKIGITHVVFKDGGKRTLEKAKETGGVVNCVGVGWVLDCERENKWLPESPYSVDTAVIPRGGHRRRKSMEPRALANMNGTLLPSATPVRPGRKTMSPSKDFMSHNQTPLTSKAHRRDSVQWVHTPSTCSSDDQIDDQTVMLTPVPATPAPEALSAYGEDGLYGDDTPGGQTPYFLHQEQLVQKTAPAGKRYFDGENGNGGFLSEKKDESVMMRLMAARRKSLQWAPKIGSPLARGGEW